MEYALLLAFIVGIAMMLNGSNLGGVVKGVFDDVAEVIANFTDSRTPEEKDFANMIKIGEGLARNFKYRESYVSDPYQDEKSEGCVSLPYNYISVVVLPDGTVDVYFDGTLGRYQVIGIATCQMQIKKDMARHLKMPG